MPRIYTRTGDDGTTGLLYGGRISKADPATEAYGAVDEAVAAIGVARALTENVTFQAELLRLQRDLFVVGARAGARRAGRRMVASGGAGGTGGEEPLFSLNRLSDLLFCVARWQAGH